jgi:hypothetical protein
MGFDLSGRQGRVRLSGVGLFSKGAVAMRGGARTAPVRAGAPATTIETEWYVGFLVEEYLGSYTASGGGAIKVVTAERPATLAHFGAELAEEAAGRDFLSIRLNAAQSRLDLVDELFVAVARQVDWIALAGEIVTQAYARAGFAVPPDPGGDSHVPLAVSRVAVHHGVHQGELYRDIRRELERAVLHDPGYVHEFRVAMLRLCRSLLGRGDVERTEEETVLRWLRGHTVPMEELRAVGLYTRVTRHNARRLITSLSRWVRQAGRAGLVLELDLTRLAVVRRPNPADRRGFYYSRSAVLDTFEILRQFVDSCDELGGTLLVVLLPETMVDDPGRGMSAYKALHLRVIDEVRDQFRANPFGSLVRLAARPAVCT